MAFISFSLMRLYTLNPNYGFILVVIYLTGPLSFHTHTYTFGVNSQSVGNPMSRNPGGGGMGLGNMANNQNGQEMVSGTLVDMSNKFIQRITGSGTAYIPYSAPGSKPSFTRRIKDTNRHFVLFPDHAYPPGSGHYVVLRKMMMGIQGRQREIVYEAYNMFLTSSARAMILNWPHDGPGAYGQEGQQEAMKSPNNNGKMKNSMSELGLGPVDMGEVVDRPRRRQPLYQPNFKTIEMTLTSEVDKEEQKRDASILAETQQISDDNFIGFSIEEEE